jgi:hypothetical protein
VIPAQLNNFTPTTDLLHDLRPSAAAIGTKLMLWTLEVLIDEKRFDRPPRKNSDLVDMLAGVVGLEKCGRTVEVTVKQRRNKTMEKYEQEEWRHRGHHDRTPESGDQRHHTTLSHDNESTPEHKDYTATSTQN